MSVLDARLAEIDRRLSTIQTGLADDGISVQRPQAPVAELPQRVEVAAPQPVPEAARDVLDQIRALADAQEQVLRSTRELLSAYERVLAELPPAAADTVAVREFSVSAGPFSSTEALRGFERTLSGIPEVREVAVRGYEGEDRAIVDVHLFEPNT
jgi:hypothetical protein